MKEVAAGPNSAIYFHKSTQEELEKILVLEKWLTEELSDTIALIEGQLQYVVTMIDHMSSIQTGLDLTMIDPASHQK